MNSVEALGRVSPAWERRALADEPGYHHGPVRDGQALAVNLSAANLAIIEARVQAEAERVEREEREERERHARTAAAARCIVLAQPERAERTIYGRPVAFALSEGRWAWRVPDSGPNDPLYAWHTGYRWLGRAINAATGALSHRTDRTGRGRAAQPAETATVEGRLVEMRCWRGLWEWRFPDAAPQSKYRRWRGACPTKQVLLLESAAVALRLRCRRAV